MVLAFDMLLDVVAVEPDVTQIPGRVALGLIAEMLRLRVAALAARGNRPGTYTVAELDDGDEAVTGGAVHLLGPVGARTEGGERAPPRRGEADRNARLAIVERLDDLAVDALVAVDFTPRDLPAVEVAFHLVDGGGERLQQLLGRALRGGVIVGRHPGLAGVVVDAAADFFAPVDGHRRRHRRHRPAAIPRLQHRDRPPAPPRDRA